MADEGLIIWDVSEFNFVVFVREQGFAICVYIDYIRKGGAKIWFVEDKSSWFRCSSFADVVKSSGLGHYVLLGTLGSSVLFFLH